MDEDEFHHVGGGVKPLLTNVNYKMVVFLRLPLHCYQCQCNSFINSHISQYKNSWIVTVKTQSKIEDLVGL